MSCRGVVFQNIYSTKILEKALTEFLEKSEHVGILLDSFLQYSNICTCNESADHGKMHQCTSSPFSQS